MNQRVPLIATVVALTLTTAAYVTKLGEVPIYLLHDEVNFSLQAVAIARDGHDINGRFMPLYFSEPEFVGGRDPLMIYATAAVLRVLPASDATARLATALVGVLSVGLMLAAAWAIFGRAVPALAAATLLMWAPGHFIHSRLALSVIYPVPFVLAWLYALARYDHSGSARMLVASGIALGVGVYSYLAGLMLMPVLLGLTVGLVAWRRTPRATLPAIGAFAVCLLPLALWQLVHPERYVELVHAYRVGGTSPGPSALALTEFVRSRLDAWWTYFDPNYLFVSGDSSLTDSTRRAGLFPFACIVLMPVGIAQAWRQRGISRLVIAGLCVAPLATILTGSLDLNRYRALVVLPFGVLTATYGLIALWESQLVLRRVGAILLFLSVPLQFCFFYQDYVGPYRATSSVWFGRNLRSALNAVVEQGTPAVVVSRRVPYAGIYWRFYVHAVAGRDAAWEPRVVDEDFNPAVLDDHTIFIAPVDDPQFGRLDTMGWVRLLTTTEPSGEPSFVVFKKVALAP